MRAQATGTLAVTAAGFSTRLQPATGRAALAVAPAGTAAKTAPTEAVSYLTIHTVATATAQVGSHDITITVGVLTRRWAAGAPTRDLAATGATRGWTAGAPHT